MSAREELVSTLEDLWLQRCGSKEERDSCRPDAEQLIDAYAHELAEEIRRETQALKDHGVLEPGKFRPCRDAADQIDPVVLDGE